MPFFAEHPHRPFEKLYSWSSAATYPRRRRSVRLKKIRPTLALKLTGMIWAGAGAAIFTVILLNALLSLRLFSS